MNRLVTALGQCRLGVSHHIGGKAVWDGHIRVPNPLLQTVIATLEAQDSAINDIHALLVEAKHRLDDMLKGDDGQAWQEAERFMERLNAALGIKTEETT